MPKYKKLSDMNPERSIYLFDYFDQDSSQMVIDQLHQMANLSSDDIHIIINSFGGQVYSLFAILDAIDAIDADVYTHCLGEADSCGAVLLSAGKERSIGTNSRIMIHEVSGFTWGKASDLENDVKRLNEVNDRLLNILAKNSNRDLEVLKEYIGNKDVFLEADKAIEDGFADYTLNLDEEEDEYKLVTNMQKLSLVFNSRDKDVKFGKIILENIKNKKQKEVSNTLKNKKGDSVQMDKDQLIAELTKHGIDVNTLISNETALTEKVTVLTNELTVETDRADKAETLLKELDEKVKETEINTLISTLENEGKITDKNKDEVLNTFKSVGIDQAKTIASFMNPVVNMGSVASNISNIDNDTDDDTKEYEAWLKTNNREDNARSYSAFQAHKYDKGGN